MQIYDSSNNHLKHVAEGIYKQNNVQAFLKYSEHKRRRGRASVCVKRLHKLSHALSFYARHAWKRFIVVNETKYCFRKVV